MDNSGWKLLLGTLFLITTIVVTQLDAEEFMPIYRMGFERGTPLFEIQDASFNASYEAPFTDYSYHLRLGNILRDGPERIPINMTGTCKNGVLKATGVGKVIMKYKTSEDVWEAKIITLNLTWEGTEHARMYQKYFDINETIQYTCPVYTLTSEKDRASNWVHKQICTGNRTENTTRRFDIDILSKVSKEDVESFNGKYVVAGHGEISNAMEGKLVELDNRFRDIEATLNVGKYELASLQLEQIITQFNALKKESKAMLKLAHLPTAKLIKDIDKLQVYEHQIHEQFKMALTNNDKALKTLEMLRTCFSADVVRAMLNSFVGWQGSIPTAPEELLGKFSFTTGLFDLPRSLLEWQTNALNDATVLKNKKNSIDQLKVYEQFWAKLRDNCTKEMKAIKRQKETRNIKKILELNGKLQHLM